MKKAFIVYQWIYGNRPVNPDFTELIRYNEQNAIEILTNKMFITGRVCADFDVCNFLVSEKGSRFSVEEIFLYGKTLNFICSGMTCGIRTNLVEEELFDNMTLYLDKVR